MAVGLENRPVASELSEIGVLGEMAFLWSYTPPHAALYVSSGAYRPGLSADSRIDVFYARAEEIWAFSRFIDTEGQV